MSFPISRRGLLRSAAASAAASPFLRSTLAQAAPPKRFVVFWVPEGVPNRDISTSGDLWWPDPSMNQPFPGASKPLEELKSHLMFVRGLGFIKSPDIHVDGPANLLTGDLSGAPTRTANGVAVPGGISIDLLLAEFLGKGTVHKHYGLGILNYVEGQPLKRRVTYRKDGDGVDPQNNPLTAFNDLLGTAMATPPKPGMPGPPTLSLAVRRLMARKSVLDDVTKELGGLRCTLGKDGRLQLDAYRDGIRDVEAQLGRQLQAAGANVDASAAMAPSLAVGADKGNQSGFWGDQSKTPEIGKLMMDIAASALAADTTRVITLQFNQSRNYQKYPWLPVAQKDREGHSFAHIEDDKADQNQSVKDRVTIMAWYAEQYAYFLRKLRSIPNGVGGTLLDDTMVLYCSEMGNGRHLPADQPFVLGGSAGGAFKQGGYVNAMANVGGLANVLNVRHQDFDGPVRMRNDLLVAIARGYGMTELTKLGRDDRNGRALSEVLANG